MGPRRQWHIPSWVMFSPYLFAVHPSVPVATFAELVAYDVKG